MVVLVMALMLMAVQQRPRITTHGRFFSLSRVLSFTARKTWLDHLVEVDPGRVPVKLAGDYADNPPEHIAVLPFVDHSNAQFRVNKIALTRRNEQQKEQWA